MRIALPWLKRQGARPSPHTGETPGIRAARIPGRAQTRMSTPPLLVRCADPHPNPLPEYRERERNASRRFEIHVTVQRVAEGLELAADRLDGDGAWNGQAHFHEEQGRAGEGGGFLSGAELFDVHVELAQQIADSVDDAGLVHGVSFETEGEAFGGRSGEAGVCEGQT